MSKNTLILGLWAFGFAAAKHLWENNPDTTFYAAEKNAEIFHALKETWYHPLFFSGSKLPDNIEFVNLSKEVLSRVDTIISVIPCQFTTQAFEDMKGDLQPWVTILNLSKGIHNGTLKTTWENLEKALEWIDYTYAYLAWGMIAQEMVDGKPLWADIVTENKQVWESLKQLFQSDMLDINLVHSNTKNTELYAAFKNIIALILWYYQGKWLGASSQWLYLTRLLKEVQTLIETLWGDPDMNFFQYALTGDLIATWFWGSRNRLLGQMLGEWKDIQEALAELKAQNKIAEWYETLKGVFKITKERDEFPLINDFAKKFLV